ncbi:MAG: DUF6675 family protein [Rectinemataceae bacterium]
MLRSCLIYPVRGQSLLAFFIMIALSTRSPLQATPSPQSAPSPTTPAAKAASHPSAPYTPRPLSHETRQLLPSGITLSGTSPILAFSERFGKNLLLAPSLEGAPAISKHVAPASGAANLLIEALVLLPFSQSISDSNRQSMLTDIALIFSQFSSLQGILYWSASRSRMRTLYVTSYRISDPQKRKRLEDPSTAEALALLPPRSYAYQKDQTFDGMVLEIEMETTSSSVLMRNRNVTQLALLSVPLLPPDGLRAGFLAAPTADGLLLYFASAVQPPLIARDRVLESASNKALALLHWFLAEASSRNIIEPVSLPWNVDDLPQSLRPSKNEQ